MNIERSECVYYPGPVPCDRAVLTVLCLLFDKIYFPNAYLPMGDYDRTLLANEIVRLDQLNPPGRGTKKLVGILRFLEYRQALDGILEYPSQRDEIHRTRTGEEKLAMTIYDAHYPPRENFHPHFDSATTKGLPESEEAISFAGDFYYQAGAILFATGKRLPLLDDGSGLTLPFRAPYKDNAKALAALIAVESVGLVLPEIPIMAPQELVEFRMENKKELQSFRASMLKFTKTVNAQISEDTSPEELKKKIKFLVESEIGPSLHDLGRDLRNPNRPWGKRIVEGVRVQSSMVTGFLTGGLLGGAAAEAVLKTILSELEAKGDKEEAAKKNGLYYLLKAKEIGR
jgi:hypothetical protein